MRYEVERYVVRCALCCPGHARYRVRQKGSWPPMCREVHRELINVAEDFATISDLMLPIEDGVEPWEYRAGLVFRWARHRLKQRGMLGADGWDEQALLDAVFTEWVDWALFDRALEALRDESA